MVTAASTNSGVDGKGGQGKLPTSPGGGSGGTGDPGGTDGSGPEPTEPGLPNPPPITRLTFAETAALEQFDARLADAALADLHTLNNLVRRDGNNPTVLRAKTDAAVTGFQQTLAGLVGGIDSSLRMKFIFLKGGGGAEPSKSTADPFPDDRFGAGAALKQSQLDVTWAQSNAAAARTLPNEAHEHGTTPTVRAQDIAKANALTAVSKAQELIGSSQLEVDLAGDRVYEDP
jgi:hypothetical protein